MGVLRLIYWRFVVSGYLKTIRAIITYFALNTRLAQWFQNLPYPDLPFELILMHGCFLTIVKWWRGPPARHALKSSSFRKLPSELIVHIANFLPPESAASLAITCYDLHSCLEIRYLRSLKQADASVLNEFLRLLERDLPGHILCPHCSNSMQYQQLNQIYHPSPIYRRKSLASLLEGRL